MNYERRNRARCNNLRRRNVSRLACMLMLPLISELAQAQVPMAERAAEVVNGVALGSSHVVGQEDTPLVIGLLSPGAGSGGVAIVKSLPLKGMLTQMDGTPIVAGQTAVTDPLGRVVFVPLSDVNGAPLTSFMYAVQLGTKQVSKARQMFITVTPVNDWPSLKLNTFGPLHEDEPHMLQLVASDPDVTTGGDRLELWMTSTVAPVFGKLYQVGEDGVTIGEAIKIQDPILNSQGLMWLVPNLNFWGNSINFVAKVKDRSQAATEVLYTLDLLPVNDPPTASDIITQATNEDAEFGVQVVVVDKDYSIYAPFVGVVLHSLPTRGTLYFDSVALENMVTAADLGVPYDYFAHLLRYVPDDDGIASPYDGFTYAGTDLEYESAVHSVTINRVYKDKSPVFDPIEPQVIQEDGAPLELLVHATNPDGPQSEVKYFAKTLPTKGTLQAYTPLTGKWITMQVENWWIWPSETPNLRYIPNPGANTLGSEPDSFQLDAWDQVSGSPKSMKVYVTINAVNDAPVIGGSDHATARILLPSGLKVDALITDLSVSDDSGEHTIGVTISATNATSLTMQSVAGLANVQASATSVSFEGTQAAINAALAAGVAFKPLSFSAGTVTMSVNDWGHTGADGSSPSLTTTHTTIVIVTP